MAFDPESFLLEEEEPSSNKTNIVGFDPDAFLAEDETIVEEPQIDRNYFAPKPLKTEKEKQEIGTLEGISNAAKNAFDSSRQAMDVVGGVTPEEAKNIAKIEFDKKSRKLAPGYDEYQKAEGVDAVWAFAKNPIEVTSNIIAEGLAGSLPALGAGLTAGGVGAAVGAPTGIGAPIGFTVGQVAGTFAGSLATEYGGKVLEELQGEGMDISDPNSIQTFFGNEELVSKARDKALKRGVPIAAFDAVSAGIGGKLGRIFGTKAITEGEKIIGKQFATKTGEAVTELGAQALLGGGGEVAGAIAAGEPIEGKAVFGEVIGEVGPGSVEVIAGRIADQRAIAKSRDDAKIKAASELSTKLEESNAPLTASVVTTKTATNMQQDKLAAQLEEELLIQETAAAAAQPPTTDATQKIIQPEGVRQEPQDGTQIGQTTETGVSDSLLGAEGIQEEGQVDPIVVGLQAVANNTATREQIASLSLSGLVDVRRGQAIINEDGEGILAQAQAQLPKLTPEERAAEVEATKSPLPTDALPTETPGATYGRESELFDVFANVRRRPVDVTEPTIGEIPQTSPMIGEQPAEPTISEIPPTSDLIGAEPTQPTIREVPEISPIVGAEPAAIVEQAPPVTEAPAVAPAPVAETPVTPTPEVAPAQQEGGINEVLRKAENATTRDEAAQIGRDFAALDPSIPKPPSIQYEIVKAISDKANRRGYNADILTEENIKSAKESGLLTKTKIPKLTEAGKNLVTDGDRIAKDREMIIGDITDRITDQTVSAWDAKNDPNSAAFKARIANPTTPAVSETITPAEPEGISVGNRIKLGKSPQTYIVEEAIPQTEAEKANNEQFYSVRNERTGETQVVEKADMKLVGGKRTRKMAASTRNEEYMRLAKDPEANREQLQRMVDEAAKAAGYDIKAIHGTPTEERIDVFGRRGELTGMRSAQKAFFFSDSQDVANTYRFQNRPAPNESIVNQWIDGLSDDQVSMIIPSEWGISKDDAAWMRSSVKDKALNFTNEIGEDIYYAIDDLIDYAKLNNIPYPSELDQETIGQTIPVVLNIKNPYRFTYDEFESDGINEIVDRAIDGGFDGGISSERIPDAYAGSDNKNPPSGIIKFVFDPSQIKSADPVTYDDAGNVIPLSQRFQPASSDIRREAAVIQQDETVAPIPEANRYTFEEAVKAVDAHFGKKGIPEGVVIVNNTTEPDLEMKAGYFVNRGQIVINLAYIAKGENLGDIIDHELGHYIFGDPEFQSEFKQFWELMTPEEKADADRIISQFYNKETGAVQMEEKQVRAFMQLIQDSKAMPKWKQILDKIKRWINEKLGTNFQVSDRGALAVLAAAHKQFKSGEQIVREIDSGVLKTAETAQDAEYLAAVERGDMETAQRMVDEAAIKSLERLSASEYKGGSAWLTPSGKWINVKPNGHFSIIPSSDEQLGWIDPMQAMSKLGFHRVVSVDGEMFVEGYPLTQSLLREVKNSAIENGLKLNNATSSFYGGISKVNVRTAKPIIKNNKGNVIPLSQRFRPTSPDIRRMAAEPRREQVASKKRGDIITTPEGIIKQTNEVLRNKFFDGSVVSDENTATAWDYIEQLLDIKSGAANALAGQINDVVDQETNSDSRMGASLFSVSLANYAAKLAAQGDNTMISYLIRRINRMPVDNLAGGISEAAEAMRAKREYNIDGYNTLKTEGKSKVERTAAALFGTDRPSEEQVKAVDDSIKASEDTSIGEPEEVAGEIERVETRTGRNVVKKIEGKIKESTEPKKEELLISFQNLNADKKIKGITLTYNPQKISPVKSIQNFIIGKLVDYRKTLIKQGASGLESTFWQTMSDQERKPGPLGEIDQAQNNELAKIVQKTLIDLGLKGEPPNTKMTDVEKVASILNKQKLSDEKRIEADQRIVSEIERRRESELASGSIPEAVNAKYDAILYAWNQAMSRQLNMPISDNMLQRLINSELKEQNTKISELVDEADGKVVAETKQNIVSSIIRKIYGVSKEFETGIEMDENYDGLKSYLEKTLDNMYALQIEKKNAAFAKRQANISLRNSVEGQAQSIIDQLADQLSDTPAFPQKQENQVKTIVQQDLRQRPDMKRKQPWTSQLTAKLIQVGVSEAQAETISNLVWRQHEIKAMDRELKELQTAAEKGSLAVIIQRIKDTPIADQQKPEWMQSVIRDYLVDAGLSEKAADTAAKLYESVIAERFAEAKQKAFEDTLSKSAPWKNYLSRNAQLGKNALKKIQDAIRTGVLDPTQTTEGIIAKENGWSGFSKEQLTRIVQLDGVISDPNNDQVTKAESMSELNKIIVKAKMPVRFRDAISSYYVGQALMGIPTFTVNIASPTFFAVRNFATDIIKYAATDPRNIPVAFQSFINSFQSLYDNSMYAFKNQIYMSGEIEYMQGQNVLSELFDKGKEQWAKGDYANGMFNMLVGATQITGRILSSLDQGAIEMMQSQNITRYTLEAMKGNRNIPKEKRSEIVNIAISGRRKIREELIASGMAPDRAGVLAELKVRSELTASLSEVGVRATDVLNASLNDALQSVGRNRAITINSLKQQQNNLRDAGILSGLAIGFLENIAQGASKSSQSQQVFAKMLYGFALVPARVFSTAAWFSPIGFVRLGIDAALKSKGIESRYALSLATELQQKQRFIEAVAGSALLFGLGAALSSSTDDDEDKFFKIVVTGNGPDYNVDKQYHDSWHKNNKPQSVAIWFGKTKTTFNIGRGGEAISIPLLFLGGLDDARIKQKLNQARKSPADFEMVAEAIGSAFYGLAQRGPFAAFTKPLFDAKQSDKFVPKLFGQVGFLGKTFVPVLGTSIARNISDFINDPIDKSSVQGAIYSNIPIVGPAIGTKALNAFGQPIRADDWGDKLFKLGVPVVMSFPKNTPENELNQLVLKKGDGPPIPTRTNAQKKFEEPLTDKEFEIYVREYGRVVSEKMFKNRKKLENMDAKNYTKELDKYVNGYSIDEIKITGASDMAVRAVKRLRNE